MFGIEIEQLGGTMVTAPSTRDVGLLPRWRGAAPIQRAIMAGDTETAAMVMHMDEGLDTGPVLASVPEPIAPQDDASLNLIS